MPSLPRPLLTAVLRFSNALQNEDYGHDRIVLSSLNVLRPALPRLRQRLRQRLQRRRVLW